MEQNVSEIKKKISKRIETNHVERYSAYIEDWFEKYSNSIDCFNMSQSFTKRNNQKVQWGIWSLLTIYEIQCILPLQDQNNILIEEFFAL